MIKTVVFDIGNVVWSTYPLGHTTFRSWAKLAGLRYPEFHRLYLEIYRQIETGHRNLKDLADSLGVDVNLLQSALDQNLSDFENYFIPETVDLIKLLRFQGLKVGCLSNTESFMSPYFYRYITPLFDYSIFSFEVGCRKPDPRVYRQIQKYIHCHPGQVLFVDDKLANVRAARALGLHALRFRQPLKLYDQIIKVFKTASQASSCQNMLQWS